MARDIANIFPQETEADENHNNLIRWRISELTAAVVPLSKPSKLISKVKSWESKN